MRLHAEWLTDPRTRRVMNLLDAGGHGAWFVGGCVRNGLLDAPVDDIDITTDARPERVMDLANSAQIRAVPTGIEHGTVTLVIDSMPFEITTLRRDVSTDGRRATVAFSDRLEEDAARRDFTMNALYATADGDVLDPMGSGRSDLLARRLRFIGDPVERIREDYLRILRFFRFHAWYGDPDGGLDADGLAACAAHVDGLERLSRERVGSEIKKLLAAPKPCRSVSSMARTGVLAHVLPGATDAVLGWLVHIETRPPDPIRRLAALGGEDVPNRLRLSKAERMRLEALTSDAASTRRASELGYVHGADLAEDILLLRAAVLTQWPDPRDAAEVARGAAAVFPLKAADLLPTVQGPALGQAMRTLEARWVAADFALTREALLQDLPDPE